MDCGEDADSPDVGSGQLVVEGFAEEVRMVSLFVIGIERFVIVIVIIDIVHVNIDFAGIVAGKGRFMFFAQYVPV